MQGCKHVLVTSREQFFAGDGACGTGEALLRLLIVSGYYHLFKCIAADHSYIPVFVALAGIELETCHVHAYIRQVNDLFCSRYHEGISAIGT